MKVIKIKINLPLKDHKKNEIVKIKVDEYGVPLDKYWRNRFKDVKIDNCITVIG